MPPPATPILPSSSWTMVERRMYLDADGVLRPAHGVHYGARLARCARRGVGFVDLEQVLFGNAGDGGYLLGGVAAVVLLHELEDRAGVLERAVTPRDRVFIERKTPLLLIVLLTGRIVAREEAIFKAVAITHDKGSVGVLRYVLMVELVLFKDVADHATQEGNVGPASNRNMHIAPGRSAGKLGIDVHDRRTGVFGLHHPFK